MGSLKSSTNGYLRGCESIQGESITLRDTTLHTGQNGACKTNRKISHYVCPIICYRFHASDEELELCASGDEDEETDKSSCDVNEASGGSITIMSASVTSAVSGNHSRDPSPMKDYLKGIGKRSTSVDAGMVDSATGTTQGSSDTWRIFHEIKGKITKHVEEKISEMKNERKSSSSPSGFLGTTPKGAKLVSSNSKDDSSISDSESMSESSSKGYEGKDTSSKDDDGSPKKCASDKETSNKHSALVVEESKINGSTTNISNDRSTSVSSDHIDLSDAPTIVSSSARKSLNSKLKSIRGLRHRRSSKSKDSVASSVMMSSLNAGAQYTDSENESGIEAAVEAYEDSDCITPLDTNLGYNIPVTDYRTSPPSCEPATSPVRICSTQHKPLIYRLKPSNVIVIFLITASIIVATMPIKSFVSGLIGGILISSAVFLFISQYITILKSENLETRRFSIPDYSKLPILEVPAVKEYHPINKHSGWMNEYPFTYEPDKYSITDTRSVYVRLEGSTLRLSHTRAKIPKRAMWNERDHKKVKFIHQRIYDIANCQVKLLPEGLTRKRLYSKKYPICIFLQNQSTCQIEILKSNMTSSGLSTEPRSMSMQDLATLENLDSGSEISGKKADSLRSRVDSEEKSDEDVTTVSEEFHDVTDENEEDEDDTFCHLDKTGLDETCLYLFARTDREKEEWFRKLIKAIKDKHSPVITVEEEVVQSPSPPPSPPPTKKSQHTEENESLEKAQASLEQFISPCARELSNAEYLRFMSRFHLQVHSYTGRQLQKACESFKPSQTKAFSSPARSLKSRQSKAEDEIKAEHEQEVNCDVMWMNALIGRVLFNIMHNKDIVEKIREKIQRKIATIKLPNFLEELLVTELEVGDSVPMIHRASRPMLDERGLWIDVDLTYEGNLCLTIETKINLIKLKEVAKKEIINPELMSLEKGPSPMFDSDVEDSAESSTDEEVEGNSSSEEEIVESPKHKHGATSKKILDIVNKIAASKYFQHAAEYKVIKKAMEDLSNKRLELAVQLKGVAGTIVINVPPPPSDRLWYGFRTKPRICLFAHPKFGEREVNFRYVTAWIEKKLLLEFQKKLVYPNLDDFTIPPTTDFFL